MAHYNYANIVFAGVIRIGRLRSNLARYLDRPGRAESQVSSKFQAAVSYHHCAFFAGVTGFWSTPRVHHSPNGMEAWEANFYANLESPGCCKSLTTKGSGDPARQGCRNA